MGKWINECEYEYDAKELAHILHNYSDYCPDEEKINLLNWAKNWEYILDKKADFDMALDSLSQRQKWFMGLIMKGISNHELERRGYYKPIKFKWSYLEQMAEFLNGRR